MTTSVPIASHLPRVVIAHQSAIPHYRIAFYRKLQKLSEGAYRFGVLYDPEQQSSGDFAGELLPPGEMGFPVLPASIRRLKLGPRQLLWQDVAQHARGADLLITDTHLANLGYLWGVGTRQPDCKWALWGHATNRNIHPSRRKLLSNQIAARIKRGYVMGADAFFAYTQKQKDELVQLGYNTERVFVVGNTVDLERQRRIAMMQKPERQRLREELGYTPGDFVIISVGRMLPGRRVEFLVDAFQSLREQQPAAKLVLIGSGELPGVGNHDSVMLPGPVTDPKKLGRYLTAADVFVAPGMVGLGILQPLVHELPLVAFNLETHGPEFDYLNHMNSHILPADATAADLADYLRQLLTGGIERWQEKRYESVAYLTLQAMAQNFDSAIRKLIYG